MSVVSTGTVDIHVQQQQGTWVPLYLWVLGGHWVNGLPINVYVIDPEDGSGLIVFDAGQDWRGVTEAQDYWPGGAVGAFYRRLVRFRVGPADALSALLPAIGYRVEDVATVVFSHLHFDHVGYLRELAHADLWVGAEELAVLRDHFGPSLHGVVRQHVDLPGLRWKPVPWGADAAVAPFDAGFDLRRDGSLVLLPTPGHTPGSLSMLVRGTPRPLLLCGDLTYSVDAMRAGRVPGVGKRKQMRETAAKVLDLAERLPGLAILPAHDPGAAARLAEATAPAG